MNAYDFIVIGSGSSGAVIASRITESGKYRVLCLEAGTRGPGYIFSRPPAGTAFLIENPEVNWCLYSEPNENLGNRQIYVPRGKMLGGSSSINAMIFNRGQSLDYDNWAQMGCRGWDYSSVLPYFKKLENTDIGSDDDRGRTGPMKVVTAAKTTPFYDLYIAAAKATGLPYNADISGPTQYGVSMAQQTISRGLRQSTATQYLAPARRRKNLTVVTGAEVSSLVFENTTCVGVRYRRNGAIHEARATKEVILSAGAVGSPKILELSGVGNPEILRKHGIELVHALPGVGENMRDHYGPALRWTFNKPKLSLSEKGRGWRLVLETMKYALFRTGFIANGVATMRVFARSHPGVEQADITLMANPFIFDVVNGRRVMSPINGFFVYSQVQRPESAGSIHIKSSDPFAAPAINYNFLATENDRRITIAGFRKAREIAAAKPLADVIEKEILPGPQVQTDEEILQYVRNTGATTFHIVGTCKMGHDPLAVVDDRLRVHGLKGLRVADASIMPTIISGNTSIPCMMIGEKCADMILEDWA